MQIRLRLAPVLTPCLSQFLLAEAFGGINSEIQRCRLSCSDRRMQIRLRLAPVLAPCLSQFLLAEAFGGANSEYHGVAYLYHAHAVCILGMPEYKKAEAARTGRASAFFI